MRFQRPKLKPLLLDGLLDRVANSPPDQQFILFLGAGASRSSGIPTARELVNRRWMPRLRQQFDRLWLDEQFPNYDEQYAAQIYGSVFRTLFPTPEQRQWEIERIIEARYPSVGYVVLAALMSDPRYQRQFHTIFTTNFDDLVQDALFLYANRKPLVVTHESLISYVNARSTRPTVIKLHGDARISPKNTDVETASLVREVELKVGEILQGCAVIFIGYGGGDRSISRIMTALPPSVISGGIYWVNSTLPYDSELLEYCAGRDDAYWIRHRDFDDLMLRINARLLGGSLFRRRALQQLLAHVNSNFFGTLLALLKNANVADEDHRLAEQVRESWAELTVEEQKLVQSQLAAPSDQLYFRQHVLCDAPAAIEEYRVVLAREPSARLIVDFLEMQLRLRTSDELDVRLEDVPAILNTSDAVGETPLLLAIREARMDVVHALIQLGADVNLADSSGRSPLATASASGHAVCVDTLIRAGADVNATTSDGYTAFLLATLNGHRGIAEYLARVGSNVHATTSDGGTALLLASFNGHDDVVEWLLAQALEINHANRYSTTALIWAAHRGHAVITRSLLNAGADVNAQNIFGKTALMEAVLNQHVVCVNILLEHGADVTAVSADGETAIQQALRLNLTAIAASLQAPRRPVE